MEYVYNQYVTFVCQSATALDNQQLLGNLQPHFDKLKQKIINYQSTIDIYQGVKNDIIYEIENNISNTNSLETFNLKLDSVIYDLNTITNAIQFLLQQPKLSVRLRNIITSFKDDCCKNLSFFNTQSALSQVREFHSTFEKEERERKEREKKRILLILKWSGIAIGAIVIIAVVTTYWEIIATGLGIIAGGVMIVYIIKIIKYLWD
jgi:DNA integrity scanning protein DisA with diadenylate cyclase activity